MQSAIHTSLPPDKDSKQKQDGEKMDTQVKKNPNPRANANIPEEKVNETGNDDGVGSEITDGEAG